MSVRNWWITVDVDGAAKRVSCGPRNKQGGFYLTIHQRDEGGIGTPIEIQGIADVDGKLKLHVMNNYIPDGSKDIRITTNRDESNTKKVLQTLAAMGSK